MIIITIRVKNIDSSLKNIFSEHTAFHIDKAGAYYMDEIISKDDDSESIEAAINEALRPIETYSGLFMNVYKTGGDTELYITYRHSGDTLLYLTPETLAFMSRYGISLGVD